MIAIAGICEVGMTPPTRSAFKARRTSVSGVDLTFSSVLAVFASSRLDIPRPAVVRPTNPISAIWTLFSVAWDAMIAFSCPVDQCADNVTLFWLAARRLDASDSL